MGFRASNVIPSTAYDTVRRAAVQLKVNLQGINVRLAAANADYDFLKQIYMTLGRANAQFNTLKTTDGLAEYAKAQENDLLYDVVQAFSDMQSAINTAIAWMDSNVPTSVTVKSPSTWDDATMISNSFTPAQTAGLRTLLANVIAEIE